MNEYVRTNMTEFRILHFHLDKSDVKNVRIMNAIKQLVTSNEKAKKIAHGKCVFTSEEITEACTSYFNSRWYNGHRIFDLGPNRFLFYVST